MNVLESTIHWSIFLVRLMITRCHSDLLHEIHVMVLGTFFFGWLIYRESRTLLHFAKKKDSCCMQYLFLV
jgi:hypothetical protein